MVQETLAVGAATAATLHDQTKQMEKIVNDLDEIHFSMKKAGGLLRDITRQIATDKCILFFLFLVVAGVVTVIVLKAREGGEGGEACLGVSTPIPTFRLALSPVRQCRAEKHRRSLSSRLPFVFFSFFCFFFIGRSQVAKPNLISGVSVPGAGALAPPSPPPPPKTTARRLLWGLLSSSPAAGEGRGGVARKLLGVAAGMMLELDDGGGGGGLDAARR